jgi:hypothetical protein
VCRGRFNVKPCYLEMVQNNNNRTLAFRHITRSNHLHHNKTRKQGIYYTKSFAPMVQWITIRMVSTLAAMHDLKGKNDITQAFSQARLNEDIYLQFPAGFEHRNEEWALKLKRNLYR